MECKYRGVGYDWSKESCIALQCQGLETPLYGNPVSFGELRARALSESRCSMQTQVMGILIERYARAREIV